MEIGNMSQQGLPKIGPTVNANNVKIQSTQLGLSTVRSYLTTVMVMYNLS